MTTLQDLRNDFESKFVYNNQDGGIHHLKDDVIGREAHIDDIAKHWIIAIGKYEAELRSLLSTVIIQKEAKDRHIEPLGGMSSEFADGYNHALLEAAREVRLYKEG